MESQDIYSTCVPSSITFIGTVVRELLDRLKSSYSDISECTLFELKVILNEVLVNAVKHGNKEDEKKQVKIEAGISRNGMMYIIVEDEGCGYDFAGACNCCKPFREGTDPLEISECGRGVMILKSLCDNVKVNARGNKIVLTKNILS